MSESPRYDGVAEWYDAFVRSVDHTPVVLDVLERLLGSGPGLCLDLGCGTGIAFPVLARLEWSIVGVDMSTDQLAVASPYADSVGAHLLAADASRLPFEAESFDAVISLLTHTDFDNLRTAFREAARVLRPGGRFVYVGVHPCFASSVVDRRGDGPPVLHPGYRRDGRHIGAVGEVRERVGVNHVPLAELLNTVLAAGIRLEQIEEPKGDDYPLLLAMQGSR
jgi:SAM-dependent methyltransferase